MKSTKVKVRNTVLIIVLVLLLVVTPTLTYIISRKNNTKNDVALQYEKVVSRVVDGDIPVKPNACFALPENMKYLSDSGDCFIVEFNSHTAIYFYSYRGILESSRGYLYITDRLNCDDYVDKAVYVSKPDFVDVEKIAEGLYSCKTN